MIKIVAENYIKEEYQEEFLKLTKELIILSREEKGNISYHLYQDINDDSLLLLLKNGKTKKQLMNIIKQNTLQQLFLKSKALLQNLQEQLNIKRCNNEYIRNNFYKKKCSTI